MATYIPPPEQLVGIPSAQRVRPKTRVAGRRRARWVDDRGNITNGIISTATLRHITAVVDTLVP